MAHDGIEVGGQEDAALGLGPTGADSGGGEDLDAAGEAIGPVADNLRSLAVSMTTMKRLLERKQADSTLMPADAALIQTGITATREEMQRLVDMLSAVSDNGTESPQALAATMIAVVAELETALTTIENALRRLQNGAASVSQ